MGKAVWRLIICEPGSASRRFEMACSEILLGRGEECDLTLVDPTVSGQHARIFVRDGVLQIQDLGSTNGSLVTAPGKPAERELRSAMTADLLPGAMVTLGATRIEVLGAPEERVSQLGSDAGPESTILAVSDATGGNIGSGSETGPELERPQSPLPVESRALESASNLETPAGREALKPAEQMPAAESGVGMVEIAPAAPTVQQAGHAATTARIHRDADSDALLRTTATEANTTLMRRRLARLTLCGQGLQQVVDIHKTPFVIGRRAELGVDLVLRHEQVSSRHLAIEFADGRFQARDLASSNGTRVNSTRLPREQPHPLPPDSGLDVGPIHCLFSCLYDDEGRTVDPTEYTRAAHSLVAEGLVDADQLAAAEDALQQSRNARHLGEILLSQSGTRLTVQRWLNALRRVREAPSDSPSGWRAIVGAASGWFGRGRS